MLLLRTFAPWVLLAFLGHQVSLSSGARTKTRGADRTAVAVSSVRAQRRGNSGRGKFTIKFDNWRCSWEASDSEGAVRLSVKCHNPHARVKTTEMQCEYNAIPRSCPGYQHDPKGFWKQVGRALKSMQRKVCKDVHVLVRASMCKRAPPDAHFKLDVSSVVIATLGGEPEPSTPPPLTTTETTTSTSTTNTATTTTTTTTTAVRPTAGQGCTSRADHQQKVEEYCSGSWASVCSFFFSMMQSDDC